MNLAPRRFLVVLRFLVFLGSILLAGWSLRPALDSSLMPRRLNVIASKGKVEVRYTPSADKAAGPLTKPLLFVQSRLPDGQSSKARLLPLDRKGSRYETTFPLESGAVFLAMKVSDGDWEDDNNKPGYVFFVIGDDGKPVQDACRALGNHLQGASAKTTVPRGLALNYFNEELRLYPANRYARLDRYGALPDDEKKAEKPEIERLLADAVARGTLEDLWFARTAYAPGNVLDDKTRLKEVDDALKSGFAGNSEVQTIRLLALDQAHFITAEDARLQFEPFLKSSDPEVHARALSALLEEATKTHQNEEVLRLYEEIKQAGFATAGYNPYYSSSVVEAAAALGRMEIVDQAVRDAEDWMSNGYLGYSSYFWTTPVQRRLAAHRSRLSIYAAYAKAYAERGDIHRAADILRQSSPLIPQSKDRGDDYLKLSERAESAGDTEFAWAMAREAWTSDPTSDDANARLKKLYLARGGKDADFPGFIEAEARAWRNLWARPCRSSR